MAERLSDGIGTTDEAAVDGISAVDGLGVDGLAVDGQALEPSSNFRLLPYGFARKFGVVATNDHDEAGRTVVIYRARPSLRTIAEVRRTVGSDTTLRRVDSDEFDQTLEQLYSGESNQAQQVVDDLGQEIDLESLADFVPDNDDLLEQENDAPIVRLINALMAQAIRENASDVHIETFENDMVVRLRVDGVLREIARPKKVMAPLLVSRIKVMARLDIAEKRIPQDGRTSLRIGGREFDVRVSTMPTASGERVVMRLLDKKTSHLQLPYLGMNDDSLVRIRDVLKSPHGIFLVTGPTGSGKTTTLYASLSEMDTNSINILTVEDPIEYNIHGIGQTQVNTKAELTFAVGLRAILRQDPDVVMVGEIRDLETARIAVRASLTGHLVLSTLHTNTAAGSINRLVDMGVEPYLLGSSLVAVLAQRLVRLLCPECREEAVPNRMEREFLGPQYATHPIFRPKGCEHCSYTGYSGRTGIYELILVDDELKQYTHDGRSETEITNYARQQFASIRDDGREKVLRGLTSITEVMRVTMDN